MSTQPTNSSGDPVRTSLSTTVRLATAVLLLAGTAAATGASAAGTPGTQKLFARQEGCGGTQEAGRLETKSGTDSADGCGTIGGLPLTELLGFAGDTFSTGEGYQPVVVRAGKVVGQVAASTWTGVVGGVGTVEVDVAVSGLTADDETVDLGSTTASAPASPTTQRVKVPFELAVPQEADGAQVVAWSMTFTLRGLNVNANAQALEGDTFVTLPITKP